MRNAFKYLKTDEKCLTLNDKPVFTFLGLHPSFPSQSGTGNCLFSLGWGGILCFHSPVPLPAAWSFPACLFPHRSLETAGLSKLCTLGWCDWAAKAEKRNPHQRGEFHFQPALDLTSGRWQNKTPGIENTLFLDFQIISKFILTCPWTKRPMFAYGGQLGDIFIKDVKKGVVADPHLLYKLNAENFGGISWMNP